jgi:hypothetical protein
VKIDIHIDTSVQVAALWKFLPETDESQMREANASGTNCTHKLPWPSVRLQQKQKALSASCSRSRVVYLLQAI